LYSFVFGPSLGFSRAGFLFSRYGFNFRANSSKSAQKQTAQENPRRIGRTYSRRRPRVKEKLAEIALNRGNFWRFWPRPAFWQALGLMVKPSGSIPVVQRFQYLARTSKGQNG
jgi:hypothetical protein